MNIWIRGMRGLGDNVFQRPFVRALAARNDVWLSTPWPELYADLKVMFVREHTTLRTQAKNIARQDARRWSKPPGRANQIVVQYTSLDLAQSSIVKAMERAMPLGGHPFIFDLPDAPPPRLVGTLRYAVVRPVTIRREWKSKARGPRPEYIQQAIDILRESGYLVVTLADVDGANEWFDGPAPTGMHQAWHKGEIAPPELFALLRRAACVVGGVGWQVPMAIAAGTPLYCVLGGRGGHNAPHVITDPRMGLDRTGWAVPDHYCMCTAAEHDCDKTITGFQEKFRAWLSGIEAGSVVGSQLAYLGQRARNGILSGP